MSCVARLPAPGPRGAPTSDAFAAREGTSALLARSERFDGERSVLKDGMRLYNSLRRRKEAFVPIAEDRATVYVCGVTVYDHAHVGHARAYVAFDVLYRALLSAGYRVTYCRNITDIDDKIIARARERNVDIDELALRYSLSFREDMERLRCLPPTMEPRATKHVGDAVDMIERIVDNGHGYHAPESGDVYFAVHTLSSYGRMLAMRDPEDNQAGAGQRARNRGADVAGDRSGTLGSDRATDQVEGSETMDGITRRGAAEDAPMLEGGKRDPADFVLWKAAKAGEPSWESPWGPGRPGWHIECSSMIHALLGDKIDIHGGGVDLLFPHHENEIAQCAASCGCGREHESFSNFWMHNGFVNVDSEKMSKSLGNFFTIKEVLEMYHPLALRWFLIGTHYRSAINYTQRALEEASERTYYLYQSLADARQILAESGEDAARDPKENMPRVDQVAEQEAQSLVEEVELALADDLNTPLAIATLSNPLKSLNDLMHTSKGRKAKDRYARLRCTLHAVDEVLSMLGMDTEDVENVLSELRDLALKRANMDELQLEKILEERATARREKNFELSDRIRDDLAQQGIMLMDGGASDVPWKPAVRNV